QQLRSIDEQLFSRHRVAILGVVAEAVDDRLEHGERLDVGLLLRRISTARREWNAHVMPGRYRRLLDPDVTREHDEIGERDLFAALLRLIELLLNALEHAEHLREV